jgi:hypothetical protein
VTPKIIVFAAVVDTPDTLGGSTCAVAGKDTFVSHGTDVFAPLTPKMAMDASSVAPDSVTVIVAPDKVLDETAHQTSRSAVEPSVKLERFAQVRLAPDTVLTVLMAPPEFSFATTRTMMSFMFVVVTLTVPEFVVLKTAVEAPDGSTTRGDEAAASRAARFWNIPGGNPRIDVCAGACDQPKPTRKVSAASMRKVDLIIALVLVMPIQPPA